MAKHKKSRRPPIFAYINLANAITSLSVACSVCAILFAMHGHTFTALWVGVATIPCDVFDGVVARKRNTSSSFGGQLDSLADAIGFGVLPAVLGYSLGLTGAAALLLVAYPLSAVWRLAYFNEAGMTADAHGRQCFTGMPTTLAAAIFYVVAPLGLWLPAQVRYVLLAVFFVATTLLMNSPYAFPKKSFYARILWLAIPIALGSLAFLKR